MPPAGWRELPGRGTFGAMRKFILAGLAASSDARPGPGRQDRHRGHEHPQDQGRVRPGEGQQVEGQAPADRDEVRLRRRHDRRQSPARRLRSVSRVPGRRQGSASTRSRPATRPTRPSRATASARTARWWAKGTGVAEVHGDPADPTKDTDLTRGRQGLQRRRSTPTRTATRWIPRPGLLIYTEIGGTQRHAPVLGRAARQAAGLPRARTRIRTPGWPASSRSRRST